MPDEYRQMFDLNIEDEGVSLNEILANCERLLETSVRSGKIHSFSSESIRIAHFQVIHVLSIN